MAGKLFTNKNYINRTLVQYHGMNSRIYNILNEDILLPYNLYYHKINNGKKKSKSVLHNKCIFSGRNRAIFNKYRMSRMIFKNKAENCLVNGIRLASW